jgi:hypothetical protein
MEKKTCLRCSLGMYLHISELKCGSRSLSEWHFSVTLNDLVCLSLHLIVEEWTPEEMDASLALCSVEYYPE